MKIGRWDQFDFCLEKLSRKTFCLQVNAVVFDKTGTLTHGSPEVVKTALFVKPAQCSVEMLLALTGTAENHSEHPIGVAITNYAKQVRVKTEARATT